MRVTSKHGFTLLEVVLAILILAILAGLTIPVYRKHLAAVKLTATTHQAKAVFDLARNYASALRRPIVVSINIGVDSGITSLAIVDTSPNAGHVFESIDIEKGIKLDTNSGITQVEFLPNQQAIFMDPLGVTISTANAILRFTDENHATSDIILFPTTGMGQIYGR